MVRFVLPFARTVFLPASSPAIERVTGVQSDLRDVHCGNADNRVFCFGEADVLLEYMVRGQKKANLFNNAPAAEIAWQALLTLPFEVEEQGVLPEDTYRVNLRELEWSQLSASAVELVGQIVIECTGAEEKGRVIERDNLQENTLEQNPAPWKQKESGGWKMVSIEDERKEMEKKVDIVDLSGGTGEVREAILNALSGLQLDAQGKTTSAEAVQPNVVEDMDMDTAAKYIISTSFPAMAEEAAPEAAEVAAMRYKAAPAAPGTVPAMPETAPAVPGPAPAAPGTVPAVPGPSFGAQEVEEIEAEEMPAPCPFAAAPDQRSGLPGGEILERNWGFEVEEREAEENLEEQIRERYKKEEVEATPPVAEERGCGAGTVKEEDSVTRRKYDRRHCTSAAGKSSAETMEPIAVEPVAMEAIIEDPLKVITERALAKSVARQVATSPTAQAVAVEAKEVVAEPAPRRRRFNGLPNLVIEAKNNDIDITAFKINITL